MLRLEDYIARRKKEDHLDEFNIEKRSDNLRICVNYIFEYFNNYLDITEAENKTALQNEKIEKYRKQLREYDPEIQEWLVGINTEYGSYLNRTIGALLDQGEFFFLLDTDSEFRSLSYQCYSLLIKKHPYLRDQTEILFLFIKEYHRVKSQHAWSSELPFISEDINEWINKTWAKHQVNLPAFASKWVNYFFDHKELWPSTHKTNTGHPYVKYDYDYKKGVNLFNINSLYTKMPRKSFTKSKKQEIRNTHDVSLAS